jgi:hypothetical protein
VTGNQDFLAFGATDFGIETVEKLSTMVSLIGGSGKLGWRDRCECGCKSAQGYRRKLFHASMSQHTKPASSCEGATLLTSANDITVRAG